MVISSNISFTENLEIAVSGQNDGKVYTIHHTQ